jgi:RES domain-containing protein
MKLAACGRLPRRAIHAKWYRAISTTHLKTALSTAHSSLARSRYNPVDAAEVPFEIIYLAENQAVALYEVEAVYGPADRPIADPLRSKMLIIDVDVRLGSIIDLTIPRHHKSLSTSAQELTGNWQVAYPLADAPTQQLGSALFATEDVEGFLAISAKMPHCKTLVIFPQKLREGSELVFSDTITGKTHRIASSRP